MNDVSVTVNHTVVMVWLQSACVTWYFKSTLWGDCDVPAWFPDCLSSWCCYWRFSLEKQRSGSWLCLYHQVKVWNLQC
jgi:hypothetical protein